MAQSVLDQARDELFSHINRCGVLHASTEEQEKWMGETVDYLAERYPDLGDPELDELNLIGMRFCAPAINHTAPSTAPAPSTDEAADADEVSITDEASVTADDRDEATVA